jgi:hypothetical protein
MGLGAGLSARDGFRYLVRDLVGPGVRELGFRGGQSSGFWYPAGACRGELDLRASRFSTVAEFDFAVCLAARHVPTGTAYWTARLDDLIPGRLGQLWAVQAGRPLEPVAASVLSGLRDWGWPAVQAALDDPGFPPDPDAAWARTFPPRLRAWQRLISPPRLGALARVLRPLGRPADKWFAELSDPHETARQAALDQIGGDAPDDPRTLPVLLDRLEHDPSDRVRWQAARALAPLAGRAGVHAALHAAAAQDEDLQVRWAARYALRLAAAARPVTAPARTR